MTNTEAILKIQEILGLKKETFSTMVTEEGVEIRAELFEVGQPIYVITPNGAEPLVSGEYTMEDGSVVKVTDGEITEIKLEDKPEEEVEVEVSIEASEEEEVKEEMEEEIKEEEEMKFVEAELMDGTLVTTEDQPLEVGVKLMILTPDAKIDAPSGEHTTSEGLVITVGEGGIIEAIEEMVEAVDEQAPEELSSELVETFTSAIEKLSKELKELKSENTELKEKFSKFSNKAAGEPIKTVKNVSPKVSNAFSKVSNIQALRNNLKK